MITNVGKLVDKLERFDRNTEVEIDGDSGSVYKLEFEKSTVKKEWDKVVICGNLHEGE